MSKKYVVLVDCYGNEMKVTEQEAKDHVLVEGNNMIWADCPTQKYKEGDWVELCFLPTYNGEWDEEVEDYVFVRETWDPKYEDEPLTIYKHFYHNIALPWEKPNWSFTHPWDSDKEKDPNCIYSYQKEWIIED